MAEAAKGKSRREREKQLHRQQIMQTALALFAEHGYNNVSMQEIADKAEFAVGTLYNLFASKEALYQEIIRANAYSMFQQVVSPLQEKILPEERLRRFIKTHRVVFFRYAEVVKLYLSEGIGLAILSKDEDVRSLWHKGVNILVSVIDEGIESGTFRRVDSMTAALALSGALETAAFAEIEKGATSEATGECLENLLLNGLCSNPE